MNAEVARDNRRTAADSTAPAVPIAIPQQNCLRLTPAKIACAATEVRRHANYGPQSAFSRNGSGSAAQRQLQLLKPLHSLRAERVVEQWTVSILPHLI